MLGKYGSNKSYVSNFYPFLFSYLQRLGCLSVSIGKFLRKDLYKNIFLGRNILSKEDDMAPYFSLGNRVIDMVIFTVCWPQAINLLLISSSLFINYVSLLQFLYIDKRSKSKYSFWLAQCHPYPQKERVPKNCSLISIYSY